MPASLEEIDAILKLKEFREAGGCPEKLVSVEEIKKFFDMSDEEYKQFDEHLSNVVRKYFAKTLNYPEFTLELFDGKRKY